jgi:hypothetical protein
MKPVGCPLAIVQFNLIPTMARTATSKVDDAIAT